MTDFFQLTPSKGNNLRVQKKQSPIYKSINKVWDINEFKINREPIPIFHFSDDYVLNIENLSNIEILDVRMLLISKINQNTAIIPSYLAKFTKIIQLCIDYQNNLGLFVDRYLYLSVQQDWVLPNKTLRTAGVHFDVLQIEEDIKYKSNSYSLSTNLNTVFYPLQTFDFEKVCPTKKDFNKYIKENTNTTSSITKSNTLYLWDMYCLHESPMNSTNNSIFKTFIRLDFSQIEYLDSRYIGKLPTKNPFI